jgi:hypothetical protein
MAGRGPAPKPAERRARRNADPVPSVVVEFVPVEQPKLTARMPNGDPWPTQTKRWWRMWRESPLSKLFGATDWSELADTAVLHGLLWSGHVSVAAELRLRVAKFGATPEDRARLRIQFAQADEADAKRPAAATPARERFDDLRVLPASGT